MWACVRGWEGGWVCGGRDGFGQSVVGRGGRDLFYEKISLICLICWNFIS